MGCVLGCFLLCAPNTMASLEITDSIFKNLYKEYFRRRFKEKFSLDTIYFSDSDVHEDLKTLLSKKLAVEFNKKKLKIKKYSFWNGYTINYISVQLAYYIFAKLINPEHQFRIKDTKMKICMYEIPEFDFTEMQIKEFKKSFFCKTDGTLIDIEEETNKGVHEALKTKLTSKLETIIDSINFSQIIPLIVQSYQKILNDKKNQETDAFDSILPIASE